MPSDERIAQVLELVAPQRDAFRSAVAQAVDEVRSFLDQHRGNARSHSEHARMELGRFAEGRVDSARFAALFAPQGAVEPAALDEVEKALAVLTEIALAGEDLFVVEVPKGGSTRAAIEAALGRAGRAFHAAQIAEMARMGRALPPAVDLSQPYPPHSWNRAERQIAPPVVIDVDGADLRVGGVEEFLEGSQRIVFVVRGETPPAALARLITPGIMVVQGATPDELQPIRSSKAPAVAALVPESAARFIHEPAVNGSLGRIHVHSVPSDPPRAKLGSTTAFRMSDDLRHLTTLAAATKPAPAPAPVTAAAAASASGAAAGAAAPAPAAPAQPDPADKLAAWLLMQAGL